ncbi:amidohydrolase family protein [Mycobacterium branderi]|uniref:Peptidase M38 n=1 Tax=Mycobacterium branderi TaxID=43348 RepID=A0ABM7KW98_9MYCO|nr:amidohydrolase family protein [Mycobacterium branderi]MCV7231838.1 amidohydrolase family protein [Mycobacterium branderi]BBZ15506.1 peptidase M38 [Mycobacterium branderi]
MLRLNNARIFDGRAMLPGTHSVTLDGNRITAIDDDSQANSAEAVDVGGMTLMPGLISCHLHPDFYKFDISIAATERPGKELPPGVMMAIGVRTCRVLLESGFTGYAGASCAHDIDAQLKMAIAEGIIPGPRIRACGHHLGTTGDMNNGGRWWKRYQTPGTDVCADGPEAMRALVREEINRGVETIKIFASAGHGQLHRTTRNMSRDEIAAIINTAHERGAKVRTHVSDKAMMLECIELGLDLIDHGDEIDEEVIEAMVQAGTFWVPSLIYPWSLLEIGYAAEVGVTREQYDHVRAMLPVAQAAGVRILIGDDYSGIFRNLLDDDPLDHQVGNYGREFAYYGAIEGLSAADVLSWGTSNAGELLVDPPERVGVIEPGALADLIVVDGDPLADLSLLARPNDALKAVIRDGVLVIDRLTAQTAERPASPPRADRQLALH